MFVVIQTGGKQISVSHGQEIFIEKIDGVAKSKVFFDKILMLDQKFGDPFLKGAEVHGEILKQGKSKKIRVFKYKPKKNSKTMYGHRQPYTKIVITDIVFEGKSIITKPETVKSVTKPEKVVTKNEEKLAASAVKASKSSQATGTEKATVKKVKTNTSVDTKKLFYRNE